LDERQTSETIAVSSEELQLIEQLREHPELMERLKSIWTSPA